MPGYPPELIKSRPNTAPDCRRRKNPAQSKRMIERWKMIKEKLEKYDAIQRDKSAGS